MFLLVPAYPGSPGQRDVKRLCVCVRACVRVSVNNQITAIQVWSSGVTCYCFTTDFFFALHCVRTI